MNFKLAWLPDVLKAAGLAVDVRPGFEKRGRAEMGVVKGVLCHHTAGAAYGNMPSLSTLLKGRPDIIGPLAHLGLGRDGTFYAVAAGRANHAGRGNWHGVTDGNGELVGIEAENTGLPGDPWPDVQMDAYARGCAAILTHIGATAMMCAGHKEYALPHGRKTDPSFDMVLFREKIAMITPAKPATPETVIVQKIETPPVKKPGTLPVWDDPRTLPAQKAKVAPAWNDPRTPPVRKPEARPVPDAPATMPLAWEENTLPPPTHGTSVRWMQARLNAHGAHLVEDGDFGIKSHTALRTFQKTHASEEIEMPWPRNAQDEASVVWPKTVAALSK